MRAGCGRAKSWRCSAARVSSTLPLSARSPRAVRMSSSTELQPPKPHRSEPTGARTCHDRTIASAHDPAIRGEGPTKLRCPTGIARFAPPPRRWPPSCRTRTARFSRCPTRARSNGISRTPAGFSRPFCSMPRFPAIASCDPAFRIAVQLLLQRRRRQAPAAPARAHFACRRADDIASRTARTSMTAMQRLLARHDGGDTELARSDRARSATRAAASGTDPDRRAAHAFMQPAATRVPPRCAGATAAPQ